jgi:hypothetical protein
LGAHTTNRDAIVFCVSDYFVFHFLPTPQTSMKLAFLFQVRRGMGEGRGEESIDSHQAKTTSDED